MGRSHIENQTINRAVAAAVFDGGEVLATSGSSVASAQLEPGVYLLTADAAHWYTMGDASVAAVVGGDGCAYITAGDPHHVEIMRDSEDSANARQYIAAIGTGNFSIVKVG
jgi:hypothetical protein